MHKTTQQIGGIWVRCKSKALAAVAVSLIANCAVLQTAYGAELASTDDLKVRWDNTLKYSTAWRLLSPDGEIANQNGKWPNTASGDLGFNKNDQINNRVDLLSEFDVAYKNIGGRISGTAWYDGVYAKGSNHFPTGQPANTQAALAGGPNNALPKDAKDIMGQHAEIDDAFVFGKFGEDEQNLTVRAGKHTLIYGESLFLGANGIAAAQGPVDIIKAWSVPNAQFKEVAMPVNQISTNVTLAPGLSLGAYFQFKWKAHRFPAVGSYFSPANILGDGSDLIMLPGPGGYLPILRGSDFSGKDNSQFGAEMKFTVADTEYGLYAARYDDKAPILSINATTLPPGGSGTPTYNLMYARNITVYGASFSTVVGGTNVAGEISTRRNVALAAPGDAFFNLGGMDNLENTPYDRGNSIHMNLSTISIFAGTGVWDAASLVAEYAFNRLESITYNAPTLIPGSFGVNPNHTRDAHFVRMTFSPQYFQVRPGVDITIPMGLGYGLYGRSVVAQLMPEHGGDFSLGLNAEIDRVWKASLNYTNFFGNKGNANGDVTGPTPLAGTFKNSFADRDFISASIQRTF